MHASIYATTDDDVRATLRLHAPAGKTHELALRAVDGQALVDADVPAAGHAAGNWRLEIVNAVGAGRIELWALRLRTDLDDAA